MNTQRIKQLVIIASGFFFFEVILAQTPAQPKSQQTSPVSPNPRVMEKWWPEGGRFGHGQDDWLELLSMDGLPIYILFKPAKDLKSKQAILFIPDFRRFPYWQLAQVLPKMREKAHVFVLFPRGHFPSKRFRLQTDIQEKMRDKDFAKNFRWDLRLTNNYIQKKTKPSRIGVVAGSYFGNLLLWDAAGKSFDYYVFFSPYRTFYKQDDTMAFRTLAATKPVVLVGGLGSGSRYQKFLTDKKDIKTKLHPQSGVIERKFMGRGYSLIYGWPGLPNPVLDRIDGLMKDK